jgi:hypothetical protein
MKTLSAVVATVFLAACAHQAAPPSRNPSPFVPAAEPMPSKASLGRFYQVSRSVDSTTHDSIAEIVVQANFRSQRVWCSNLEGPPTRLSLSLVRHVTPAGATGVLLGVEYQASEGLLVSGDGSLELKLNGSELHPLQAGEPVRREAFTRSETMHYLISTTELRRIVDADTASMHLQGRAGRCDSPLTGHARGLIALFMERELGSLPIAEKR